VAGRIARRHAGRALESLVADPAEVGTPLARREKIHLLGAALSYIARKEVAGQAVEREAERVAEAVRPDLVAPGLAHERVGGGYSVGTARRGVGIDPEQLSEQRLGVLAVAVGVVNATAVAGRDVEQVAVGSGLELPSVVGAPGRVLDAEQPATAVWVRLVRARGRALELVDHDVATPGGIRCGGRVKDVEATVLLIAGVKGNREETSLALRRYTARDFEEGLRKLDSVADDPDRPDGSLGDEQAAGVTRRRSHVDGLVEGASDLHQPGGGGGRVHRGAECKHCD
jgi:hypothetical protein